MPLKFHPKQGTIVVCNFDKGFKEPEMVKRRPVIVLSPRLRKRDSLCTVIPLSTTAPEKTMDYHYSLNFTKPLPPPWDAENMWVKGDMLYTVGFHRLELIRTKKNKDGTRKYIQPIINKEDLENIQNAGLHGIGMSHKV